MKKLLANLIDQIIVFGGGILLLILVTLIMKWIGFEFTEDVRAYTYVVSAAIVGILYFPIVESSKLKTTIGKKLLNV